MRYRSSGSSGFQCVEEYIPVLVIGSDGPPKPKKNQEVPLSISILKEPRVRFLKRPSAVTPLTRNSSFAQGFRSGYLGKTEMA